MISPDTIFFLLILFWIHSGENNISKFCNTQFTLMNLCWKMPSLFICPSIHIMGKPFVLFCASYVQISHYTFIVLLVPQARIACANSAMPRAFLALPIIQLIQTSVQPILFPILILGWILTAFDNIVLLPFRFNFVKEQFYLNWRLTNNLNEKGNPVFLDSLNRWGLLFVPNRGGFIRRNNVEARFTVCSFGRADYLIYDGRRKTGSDENNFQVIAFLLLAVLGLK